MARRSAENARAASEIPPIRSREINWKRRLACERDIEKFGRTYMAAAFTKPSSDDHLRCNEKIERVFLQGGMFAFAMPRAGGKTAKCRAGMLWGISYAHRRFPFFVGANDDAAKQTLAAVRAIARGSAELVQDFPELFHPIQSLRRNDNRSSGGQLYRGLETHIEWGSETVRFPCILLDHEDAKPYLDNLDGFLVPIEDGLWMAKSAGAVIHTAGMVAGIRGANVTHPITLELMRPDVVLLDDVQKDQGAESPATCTKLIRTVEGAIGGLAGPGEQLAMFMPCTVIREGDVSDTYLDRAKKPEWQGERCSLVTSWPEGITDYEISLDTDAGRHWTRYGELWRESYRLHGDIRLATEYYRANRTAMDRGFVVSWVHRYSGDEKYGGNRELSAQQHAMNLRLKSPETFPAEYQNRPKPVDVGSILITPAVLRERVWSLERGVIPADTHCVNAFIDVQNEVLFWLVLATAQDFTGGIVEYGTWPEVDSRYFRKFHTEGWGLLSSAVFSEYPDLRGKAERTKGGKLRAPLEAKIYHALKQCVAMLRAKRYPRMDIEGGELPLAKIAIDARWGKASDCIKRFVRDTASQEVVQYQGIPISPAHKQFEEYQRTPGWLFEDQVHPGLQEAKWVWRPDSADGMYRLSADVNRLKTFTMERLACPLGTPGAIVLHNAPPEQHEMISDHIAGSEYPEPVSARGRTKDMWKLRDARPDNDWLDGLAGCMALASWGGCRLNQNPLGDTPIVRPKRRRWSDVAAEKRGAHGN